ncbi:MAG: PPC domain-containing protein, partial [Planctomycetota bacterium]
MFGASRLSRRLSLRRRWQRWLLASLTAVAVTVPVTTSWAQLPSTSLTSLFPLGAKQGSQLEVTITGTDLDDAAQLLFSHPGIVATLKMGEANELQSAPRPVANTFVVKIAADVPPGMYESRVVSRFGVSNPRMFAVGAVEELIEAAGNTQIDKAMELPLGAVVSARADANARDFYKINLQAGQRVLVECWAERIDSRMDATLVLINAAGKEVARSRDQIGRDPLLDFTAPAAGPYVIAVYDFVYAGGAEHFYRLSAHTRPYVDFVFPPSGLAGSNNSYTLFGRNLPNGQPAPGITIEGKPVQKLAVNIPLPGEDAARQTAPSGYSPPQSALIDRVSFAYPGANAVSVAIAKAPVVAEQEPNNLPSQAQKLTVPFELVGQFYPQRDVDWVQFDAKKGDIYSLDLISHRLGLESDPFMRVVKVGKNDKGEETMTDVAAVDDPGDRNTRIGSDFDTSTDDPSYRLAVPEDGTYRVLVRDQFGDGRQDPRNVYRLVVKPLQSDFGLVVVQSLPAPAPNQPNVPLGVPVLRRGGSTTFQLTLDRRDDFKGEVSVTVEGLPAGVTCPGAVLGGDVSTAPLVFSAAESAGPWAGSIRIVGKSNVGGKELVRVARVGAATWGTANRQNQPPKFRLTNDLVLAVLDKETSPAFVQVGEDKVWETSLGGKVEIPVNLARRGEYKEAVKLTAVGLPAEIKPNEINLDPNTAAGKLEVAISNQQTKPGTYTFQLRADTKMKMSRNPDAIKTLETEQAFVVTLVTQRDQKSKEANAAKDAAVKAAADAAAATKTAEQAKTTTAAAAKTAADNAKAAADKAVAAK